MIGSLALSTLMAGLASAWASRPVRLGWPFAIAALTWFAGILVIRTGLHGPVSQSRHEALISAGLTLVLLSMSLFTALALGRYMRGRVAVHMAGVFGGSLTFLALSTFLFVAAV